LFWGEFLQRSKAPGGALVPARPGHIQWLFTVRQASAEMIIIAGSIGLLDRRPEV
jgi:hypothetical protein